MKISSAAHIKTLFICWLDLRKKSLPVTQSMLQYSTLFEEATVEALFFEIDLTNQPSNRTLETGSVARFKAKTIENNYGLNSWFSALLLNQPSSFLQLN